jgi:hypothetical protein
MLSLKHDSWRRQIPRAKCIHCLIKMMPVILKHTQKQYRPIRNLAEKKSEYTKHLEEIDAVEAQQ